MHAVKEIGVTVKEKQYSITKNGLDMFGFWQLDQGNGKKAWSVGIRNSCQKHFSIGICAGLYVFVCDNLALKGDYIEMRKHSGGLTIEEIQSMFVNAFGEVMTQLDAFDKWFMGLQDYMLSDFKFKLITFDAIKGGAITPSQFNNFLEAYDEEKKVNDSPGTLYDFHNAGTRIVRGKSLFHTMKTNTALEKVVTDYQALVSMV
jgi:hypothetical protein